MREYPRENSFMKQAYSSTDCFEGLSKILGSMHYQEVDKHEPVAVFPSMLTKTVGNRLMLFSDHLLHPDGSSKRFGPFGYDISLIIDKYLSIDEGKLNSYYVIRSLPSLLKVDRLYDDISFEMLESLFSPMQKKSFLRTNAVAGVCIDNEHSYWPFIFTKKLHNFNKRNVKALIAIREMLDVLMRTRNNRNLFFYLYYKNLKKVKSGDLDYFCPRIRI